ncbi:unnamed protein product, partial [Tetraodon nigroviridis]
VNSLRVSSRASTSFQTRTGPTSQREPKTWFQSCWFETQRCASARTSPGAPVGQWECPRERSSNSSCSTKEQQHQRPDSVCSRGHRLQPAALPARGAAGGRGGRRLHHEALSSFQLQTGSQEGPVQRPAHAGICTLTR